MMYADERPGYSIITSNIRPYNDCGGSPMLVHVPARNRCVSRTVRRNGAGDPPTPGNHNRDTFERFCHQDMMMALKLDGDYMV